MKRLLVFSSNLTLIIIFAGTNTLSCWSILLRIKVITIYVGDSVTMQTGGLIRLINIYSPIMFGNGLLYTAIVETGGGLLTMINREIRIVIVVIAKR